MGRNVVPAIDEATSTAQARVCIATPTAIGASETFIAAIVDRLPCQKTHIGGYGVDFSFGGIALSDLMQRNPSRWVECCLNMLPRYVEFRIRQRWFPRMSKKDSLTEFLKEQRCDAVLAQYGTIAATIVPACRAAGIPLVPHFHGFDASRYSTIKEMSKAYLELFNYAHFVIAVSQRMRNDLMALGCDEHKIRVIHYGPHPDFFESVPNYASGNLVMVGRLTDQKAPHLSLLAFERIAREFPGIRLRIIGDGELRGVCRDMIAALGLSERVDLLGVKSRQDVLHEFSNASIFLQHSVEAVSGDREGTPVAILEASAAALPVISTRHAGIPDVIVENETGLLVKEGDVEGMANAIRELLRDQAKRQRLGEAGRHRVGQKFSMAMHINGIHETLVESIRLNRGHQAKISKNLEAKSL
jgi:colanic acid/amylovoran biosynthesis glycosyltransferase